MDFLFYHDLHDIFYNLYELLELLTLMFYTLIYLSLNSLYYLHISDEAPSLNENFF
jgi:hypothetical protein